jgi:hypothetical protein
MIAFHRCKKNARASALVICRMEFAFRDSH